jgi:undecaprenyl-diphosphatase
MNEQIFTIIHSLAGRNASVDRLIIFCAEQLGLLLFVAWVLWFLYAYRKSSWYYAEHLALVLSPATISWIVAEIVKEAVHSARPFAVLSDPAPLYLYLGSHAFPSGHAAFFFGLAFALLFEHRRAGAAFLVGAFLVGLARIAAGIHWPIDILGGALLGFLIALVWSALVRKFGWGRG